MAAMEMQHDFFYGSIKSTWQTTQCRLCCVWKHKRTRLEHHHTKSRGLAANTLNMKRILGHVMFQATDQAGVEVNALVHLHPKGTNNTLNK